VIVYLHGFRSSPASRKATMLREALAALGRSGDYVCPALPASPARSVEIVLAALKGVARERVALSVAQPGDSAAGRPLALHRRAAGLFL
jgi:predicted esterase YcpF (UPF0227 family)